MISVSTMPGCTAFAVTPVSIKYLKNTYFIINNIRR
jgi:hypothetical protein